MMPVELVDPWHEPGYRIEVPITQGDVIDTWAITDLDDQVDPVTYRRPSDVHTGRYERSDIVRRDGTPVYVWVAAACRFRDGGSDAGGHRLTLDEAWVEVEAALPEDAFLIGLERTFAWRDTDDQLLPSDWLARAQLRNRGMYEFMGTGPTPAAALQALAQRMQEAVG